MVIFTFLGIFLCPIFTLACILSHYNHEELATVAFIYSFTKLIAGLIKKNK